MLRQIGFAFYETFVLKISRTIHNNAILRIYLGTNFWFTPSIMSRQQDRHHKNDQEQNKLSLWLVDMVCKIDLKKTTKNGTLHEKLLQYAKSNIYPLSY